MKLFDIGQKDGGVLMVYFVRMKTGRLIVPLLLLLAFAVFIIRRWNEPQRKEAFDRKAANLVYTKHALCRMNCRQISRDEVVEIMERGAINFSRSNRRDQPCPTFALQGRTTSGENLRVIFAQCPTETKVITCYNIKQDFECHCLGDPSTGSGQVREKKERP